MILLDTNVFLRFAIPDDPARAHRCDKLLRAVAEGRQPATVTPMAIAEVAWVMLGSYRLHKSAVVNVLRYILNTQGLEVIERDVLMRTLELFETHPMDFIDAYHAAFMQSRGIETIYSYDSDFDQVSGITRREP